MRKLKIDKSETHKPSNYIDVYNCPICMMFDNKCSMCDDEYQCQECEIIVNLYCFMFMFFGSNKFVYINIYHPNIFLPNFFI